MIPSYEGLRHLPRERAGARIPRGPTKVGFSGDPATLRPREAFAAHVHHPPLPERSYLRAAVVQRRAEINGGVSRARAARDGRVTPDDTVPVTAVLLRLRRPPPGIASYLAVADVELVVAGLAIVLRGLRVVPAPGPKRLKVLSSHFIDLWPRANVVDLPPELARAVVDLIRGEFGARPISVI